MSEDDDFVFKPATSPKSISHEVNEAVNKTVKTPINIAINSTETTAQSPQSINSQSTQQTNYIRFPFLDELIKEKRKEMDFELNKLAKIRFEEFLEKEKAADRQREEEFQVEVVANETVRLNNKCSYEDLDKKEEDMFKEMTLKAQETWKELKSDFQKSLDHLHIEQSARLSQELQLQESLQASGSVFDRELFEKVVDKCGKGRTTAFGKEKMARFWEVLDKTYPKGSGSSSNATSPNKLDDDKLLASLLGM